MRALKKSAGQTGGGARQGDHKRENSGRAAEGGGRAGENHSTLVLCWRGRAGIKECVAAAVSEYPTASLRFNTSLDR